MPYVPSESNRNKMGRISVTGSVMFSPVLTVSGIKFQLYFAQTI
jgi:hypothetical protein